MKDSFTSDATSIQKSLEGLSPEEKINKLVKRLADSESLNEKLKVKASQNEVLQKANKSLEVKVDKLNQLLLKTEESKSKLEELCRTLQKYNKDLREESASKIRFLETERQNAVEQLKTTLKDIEKSMKEGRERSDRLADDNKRLAEKLQDLGKEYESRLNDIAKQYEAKDRYIEELKNTKDLEVKLMQAKLEAASCNSQKLNLEKQQLANNLLEGTVRATDALQTEKILREQVKEYADKYSILTESLSKSNTAFDRFKKELDKVNSNMKKVENDALKWKQKYDEASKNVLVLTMAKKELEDTSSQQNKKVAQLEQLCRALRSGEPAATEASSSETKPSS